METAFVGLDYIRDIVHDRHYEVVVVEDACAAADDAEHRASMDLLRVIAKIVRVEDLDALP